MGKPFVVPALALSICFFGAACQVPTKSSVPAPTNALTQPTGGTAATSSVHVPSAPVHLSGSGEAVQTASLEPGGYTVRYTNTSGYLIVHPVNRDGSTGSAIINAAETSGVTTYASTGPVTLQITNTRGPWTLDFVPLS